MHRKLLYGAKIVLPEAIVEGSLLLHGNIIEKIIESTESGTVFVERLKNEEVEVFDISGKYILPGLIDAHVHFRTPGHEQKEDWLTGSKAALAGGVTTVFDMPNTNPPTINAEALGIKRAIVAETSLVNYGFFAGATLDNLDQVKDLKGIVGIKIYMGSSTGNLLLQDLNKLREFMEQAKPILAVHAENEDCLHIAMQRFQGKQEPSMHSVVRPPQCAEKAVKDLLNLASQFKKQVHLCHCSTKGELELVKEFLEQTRQIELISVEVTPHHLFLNDQAYEKLGNYARVNPPLRSEEDRKALWRGIEEGVVTMIATDHAPHLKSEKEQEYLQAPSGMPGVQTMLPLLLQAVHEGKLTLQRLVELGSMNPAKRFKIFNKGMIREGYDADLVVVDLDKEQILKNEDMYSKCGWTPFDGMKVKGAVEKTFVNGELMFDSSGFVDEKNSSHQKSRFGTKIGKEIVLKS